MVLFNFINPLYYAIAWTVIHSIWQVFFIALVAGLLQMLFRNYSAKLRYHILLFSICSIIVSTIFTFLYYYNLSPEAIVSNENIGNINSSIINSNVQTGAIVVNNQSVWTFQKLIAYVNNHIYIIVMIWLAGMVLALLRLLGNISFVFYLKKNMNFPVDEYWTEILNKISKKINLKKSVEILESALVRSPVVLGHIKPIIFFPIGAINRLSVEEVEAILAHELAHIARHDYLMNIIINIAESIYYFNPAMWWLSSQLKSEREHCCDDIAIQYTGNRLDYAKSLIAVQEMSMYSPILAMSFAGNHNKNKLLFRVNRLLKTTPKSFNMKEKSIASMVVCFLAALVFLSAKPIDNGNHCSPTVPSEAGLPNFLKFSNNNNLDSLELSFDVNDGEYEFSDHLYDVTMQIQNRFVVSFNLNGLEIAGKDISKFQNLIEQILHERYVPLEQNIEEPIEEPENANSANEQAIYDGFIAELQLDKLLKVQDINHIHFNFRNMMVNDQTMSGNVHKKYIDIFKALNGGQFNGDTGIAFSVVLDKYGTIIQENTIGISPPSYINDDVAEIKANASYSYGASDQNGETRNHRTEQKFDQWLEQELIKDGYIKDISHYSMVWNNTKFLVNNLEVDATAIKKYAAKREEMTGLKITESFIKTKTVIK